MWHKLSEPCIRRCQWDACDKLGSFEKLDVAKWFQNALRNDWLDYVHNERFSQVLRLTKFDELVHAWIQCITGLSTIGRYILCFTMGFDEFHGWQICPWLTSASLFLSVSVSPHATWSVWSSTCGCRDWARSSWLTWIGDEGATGRIFRYSIPVFRSLGIYHLSSIIEVDSLNITAIPVGSFPSYHNIPWLPCVSAQNTRWASGYIAV